MIAAQLAGRTRLDLPLMLGTITTEDPDRARVAGFAIHLAIGAGLRPLLRRRVRRPRPIPMVAGRNLRSRPRGRRVDGAGAAASWRPPAHGQRAGRPQLDRRARTPWTVRPQLRHRHPAGRRRAPTSSTAPCSVCSSGAADVRPRADRRLRADRRHPQRRPRRPRRFDRLVVRPPLRRSAAVRSARRRCRKPAGSASGPPTPWASLPAPTGPTPPRWSRRGRWRVPSSSWPTVSSPRWTGDSCPPRCSCAVSPPMDDAVRARLHLVPRFGYDRQPARRITRRAGAAGVRAREPRHRHHLRRSRDRDRPARRLRGPPRPTGDDRRHRRPPQPADRRPTDRRHR